MRVVYFIFSYSVWIYCTMWALIKQHNPVDRTGRGVVQSPREIMDHCSLKAQLGS